MRPVSGDIRFVRSYPLASFGHVKNFERTPPDKYVRWVRVTHALVCGLSGSRAVCPVLMRSASCRYPVCIRWCPFDLSCERSTPGQVTEYPGRVPCGSTKCSPTQYAPFSSILCTLHTQYAPLERFVYPTYTICYQWSILCRVDTYVISVVVRGYTICSSWKHVSWYLPFFLTVLSTSICLSYEPYV